MGRRSHSDSIDGPPQSIFSRLVQDLGDEAVSRQMGVVSRQGPAQYRVRGYLAALVQGKRRTTVISWVWDVYDGNQQRVVRISGEEPGGGSGRGTWAAADDGVLRRIASNSMDRLAAFLAAPAGPAAPPTAPGPTLPRMMPLRQPPSLTWVTGTRPGRGWGKSLGTTKTLVLPQA